MKGYIAFCPHFHQPHFQLYRTREEAYRYSYLPWLDLLEESVEWDKFFINLHFSGPFLYWMRDSKPEFVERLQRIVQSKRAGIIGGLADEPFIQLSSRRDDFLYQLQSYDQLCQELIGVKAGEWQGIHLVERECGEFLLEGITRAAKIIGAPPIYYLDAETFYESYFAYPGSSWDYCYKHFGFKDPFSKTTVSHLPQAMLFFGLRDEIAGQAFYSLPVHTQFRYQLLKRNSFTEEDHIQVKPSHYLFYIKDAMEEAAKMARSLGKEIDPILLIFEDAEKFGQWSKDPDGDTQWLREFFRLVIEDDELEFTGLQEYLSLHGFLDTYPVRSSHSYPEWENWMAKRGIRGVTLGDERLRRVLMRLRILEEKQDCFEAALIQQEMQQRMRDFNEEELSRLSRSLLESSERFRWVEDFLSSADENVRETYGLINRLRNLLYQEDPKWASRHPSYGSSPYYDLQGLAYLEMTERLFEQICFPAVNIKPAASLQVRDVDVDGAEEVWIETPTQTLCIDLQGACVDYHYVVKPLQVSALKEIREDIQNKISPFKAYHSVFRDSCGLVMTETESSMKDEFYQEGGRHENCRNAYRAEVLVADLQGDLLPVGFHSAQFNLTHHSADDKSCFVCMEASRTINLADLGSYSIRMEKCFTIAQDKLELNITVDSNLPPELDTFLQSEWVVSAAPSDEVDFRPRAFLGMGDAADDLMVYVHGIGSLDAGALQQEEERGLKADSDLDYIFTIKTAAGELISHKLSYHMELQKGILEQYDIFPGVEEYYEGYVFPDQSSLGYHTSGIRIEPSIRMQEGQAKYRMTMGLDMNVEVSEGDYAQKVSLIQA